jgi:hypothetical protein
MWRFDEKGAHWMDAFVSTMAGAFFLQHFCAVKPRKT